MILFVALVILASAFNSEACQLGWYGSNCDQKCPVNCHSDYGCDKTTGQCIRCDNGLWGSYCEHQCSSNCEWSCDSTQGYCHSCKDGFKGTFCTEQCPPGCLRCSDIGCSECVSGFWGNMCEFICETTCTICDQQDGTSQACYPGFSGQNCTDSCPECYICQKSTGQCQVCRPGFWGGSCGKLCTCPDGQTECGILDGRCGDCPNSCQYLCDDRGHCSYCSTGLWGSHCQFQCNASNCEQCVVTTGLCEICAPGLWTIHCNESCPSNFCLNGRCDISSGNCSYCSDGRWGSNCEKLCETDCNHCHRDNGECYDFKSNSGLFSNINFHTVGFSVAIVMTVVLNVTLAQIYVIRRIHKGIHKKKERSRDDKINDSDTASADRCQSGQSRETCSDIELTDVESA